MDALVHWTHSEKKAARALFDRALDEELAELLAELKQRAAQASTPDDIWPIGAWLTQTERDLQRKYDYRYSQLLRVFAQLLRERRISLEQLSGLAEEKCGYIRRLAERWSD